MKNSRLSHSLASPTVISHYHSASTPFKAKIKTLQKKKAVQTSRVLNFSHSSSNSTLTSPMLTTLRSRHGSSVPNPDPALACQVVSNYLIPLFEAESQHRGDQTRSHTLGTKRASLDPLPGTIYGELRLSDQLGKELIRLREELTETKARLRESEQRKASAVSDAEALQKQVLSCESHLKGLRVHFLLSQRHLETITGKELQLLQELKTLQSSYHIQEEALKNSNSLLQEQYALVDKLRNRLIEQEHINSLLLMENDIVGERLKGLFFAIQRIADCHYIEEQFTVESTTMSESVKKVLDFADDLCSQIYEIEHERDAMQADNEELVKMRNEMRTERDKMAKVAKEKITDLIISLQKTEDEREKLLVKCEETEKNFKALTEEYEKMRQKAKQYRMRRKQFGEEEEKMCRNCQKVFVESENFNWTCRRHPNEYSGEVYWCCGKSNRDAIGCKISKHESKEDEEEGEIAGEGRKQTTLQCPVSFIQSCKKFGHIASDCPKDPNPRTAHDVFDEVSRINTISSVKRKGSEQLESVQALELLIEKNSELLFNQSVSDSLSIHTDSPQEGKNGERRFEHFSEILKLKQEVGFGALENTHTVEDFLAKEPQAGFSHQHSKISPDLGTPLLHSGQTRS